MVNNKKEIKVSNIKLIDWFFCMKNMLFDLEFYFFYNFPIILINFIFFDVSNYVRINSRCPLGGLLLLLLLL